MTTDPTKTKAASQGPSTDIDAIPTTEAVTAAWNIPVRDRTGKETLFGDLVAGPNAAPRVLVIFVRHWFCPACQSYVRQLAAKVAPETLSNFSVKASIVIIGSGGWQLIDHWVKESACPFPVYTDKSVKLYELFNFLRDRGQSGHSEYHDLSKFQGFLKSASQWARMPHKIPHTGDPFQHGGELLFEVVPSSEDGEKEVTWCHRMQHASAHAGFAEVFKRLGIEEGRNIEGAA